MTDRKIPGYAYSLSDISEHTPTDSARHAAEQIAKLPTVFPRTVAIIQQAIAAHERELREAAEHAEMLYSDLAEREGSQADRDAAKRLRAALEEKS